MKNIGRYEVDSKAGAGAFGVVYRARDPLLDRDVAIKVPKVASLSQEAIDKVIKEFYHEAAIAGRFTHPNICTIYDVGRDESLDYMVMEYVPGSSLKAYLKQVGPAGIEETLDIIYKCCLALDYIHFNGIVHRDIKPDNIMYNPAHGLVKLMDFSIAHSLEYQPPKDDAYVSGTVAYMAPEHFDKSSALTLLTDIFALGSTMYELLTGKPPFRGDVKDTIQLIRYEKPQPMLEIRADIPIELVMIARKAMAKSKDDRFQTALEFAEALTKARKSLLKPVASPDPSEILHEEMEYYLTMRRSEWFQHFSPEQVNELLQIGTMEKHAQGEAIISEGTAGDSFYLLLEGNAQVICDDVEIARIKVGDCFGESSLIEASPRSASVIATGLVKLWSIRAEALDGLSTEGQVGFYRTLMEIGLHRLNEKTREVVSYKKSSR